MTRNAFDEMHFMDKIICAWFRDTSLISLTADSRNALDERHFVDKIIPVQGLTLSFYRYLSKGQVNLYLTCPRAQVTCPNTKFLYKHYIFVQITNVITINLIMMYPLFKTLIKQLLTNTLYSTYTYELLQKYIYFTHLKHTHPHVPIHAYIHVN